MKNLLNNITSNFTQEHSSFNNPVRVKVNDYPCMSSIYIAHKSPLGSCGLFTMRGSSYFNRDPDVVFNVIGYLNNKLHRPHVLLLDRVDSIVNYIEIIKPYLVQINKPFKNPSGGMTQTYILDAEKIYEDIIHSDM